MLPIFPSVTKRRRGSFPDPSVWTGTKDEKLAKIHPIRETIKERVETWCGEMGQNPERPWCGPA